MPAVDGTNYPGPFELRIYYQTAQGAASTNSQFRVSLDLASDPGPGLNFDDYAVKRRDLSSEDLGTLTDELVTILRPFFNSASASLINAELWKYEVGTYNAQFYASYTLGLAGTSGSSTQAWNQVVITFRSTSGGSARLTLMQTVKVTNVTDPYPFADTQAADLAAWAVGAQSWVLARDGGYLHSPKNYMSGQNEHLFKVTNRP